MKEASSNQNFETRPIFNAISRVGCSRDANASTWVGEQHRIAPTDGLRAGCVVVISRGGEGGAEPLWQGGRRHQLIFALRVQRNQGTVHAAGLCLQELHHCAEYHLEVCARCDQVKRRDLLVYRPATRREIL